MKRLVSLLLLFLLFHITTSARAEGGCPPGQYPQSGQGWQSCVPIPGYDNGASSSPAPAWTPSWQALVTDTPKGILGSSIDMRTAQAAEDTAMMDCRSKGGTECELQISFGNGCVAMVIGDKLKNVKGAPTKAEAEKKAISQCQESDTSCRVYYSACSLPKRVH